MAGNDNLMDKSVNQFSGGLHTDNSPVAQPESTLRFALNSTDETEVGDMLFSTNLESNIEAGAFPDGYTPIGKCYMVDGKTAIFLVGPNGESEIGIYEDSGKYTTKVNDKNQTKKLGFDIEHQIDAVYRLRRGCDHTIYWTDNNKSVRQYIFNKEEDYQITKANGSVEWNIDAFSLFKRWKKTPIFSSFNVLENGSLVAGSYNIAIQYLDSDLNPTEWITVSDTINIYHSSIKSRYSEIRGSSNKKTEYQNWGDSTGKSLEVTIDNLDSSFNFYRLALIQATNGSGNISKVTVSQPISTSVTKHLFENNGGETITIEEINEFSLIIDKAQSIEQIENRLILGNTEGKQVDFCKLQEYASKIVANYKVEKVVLNSVIDNISEDSSSASSKDPLINMKKVGYMPGEIYSFGIVYYFKDGSSSPVYHIPGRPDNDISRSNMSTNNKIESRYSDSSNCTSKNYWGEDYVGNALIGTQVRHHRFPTRQEANMDFVKEETISQDTKDGYSFKATFKLGAEEESTDAKDYAINIVFSWSNGSTKTEKFTLKSGTSEVIKEISLGTKETSEKPTAKITSVPEVLPEGSGVTIPDGTLVEYTIEKVLYTANILGIEFSNIQVPTGAIDPDFVGNNEIVGYRIVRNPREEKDKTVLDSGVLFPISKYENFLAYGHSIPSMEKASFKLKKSLYAFIHPEFLFNKREYTQTDIKFVNFGEFASDEGEVRTSSGTRFKIQDRLFENFAEDVYPGTSYDAEVHRKSEKDNDGFSLHTATKVREAYYKRGNIRGESIFNRNIRDIYYLDALSAKSSKKENLDVFNISSDNRVGIVELKEDTKEFFTEKTYKANLATHYRNLKGKSLGFSDTFVKNEDSLSEGVVNTTYGFWDVSTDPFFIEFNLKSVSNTPYFYMVRDLKDSYGTFRSDPYYSEHDNIKPISSSNSGTLFNGDAYISPMTYTNSFFHDLKMRKRETKSQIWKYVVGGLLVISGVLLAVFTGGSSLALTGTGIGLMGVAAGISTIASGIKMEKVIEVYNRQYELGLKNVAKDTVTNMLLSQGGAVANFIADDEIQWYNEVITGLWFESQVNFSVRQGNTIGVPDFLDAPFYFEEVPFSSLYQKELGAHANADKFRRLAVEKVSVLEPERSESRLYQGFATAEFYEVNRDFYRREREKMFFHLGLEYDCCSDCVEKFPHRIHYSEQSFQEENVDNYRIFLPNNYRDIPGETGAITNLFKIQNNFFVHTEEAIWNMPKNYQERVTDQIVSFVGTGDYFSIPPQKLVDDETGNSYGTRHKWSRLKIPYGYFFACENQNCFCQFDGNKVVNISNRGNYYWFYNNIPILGTKLKADNPSNAEGSGFISVFDSKKELVFFTKKDKLPTGEDASWTISFSLKKGVWASWHSFMPNFYIQTSQWFFSWIAGNNNVWRHNRIGHYQTYYGKRYPYIIEYVINKDPLQNKIFNDITIQVESRKFDSVTNTFYDTSSDFFTKMMAYNSRQCTGVVDIIVKDKEDAAFIESQVKNKLSSVIADRIERDWHINELRDMVVIKHAPMFTTKIDELQDNYFIDKELNTGVINFNKDWFQIESFRDKYLVVRFIFDKFEDVKLIANFTLSTETKSLR